MLARSISFLLASKDSIIPVVAELDSPLRVQVREAFEDALRMLWIAMIPFSVVGLAAGQLVPSRLARSASPVKRLIFSQSSS